MAEFFIDFMEGTKKGKMVNVSVVYDSGGEWRHE